VSAPGIVSSSGRSERFSLRSPTVWSCVRAMPPARNSTMAVVISTHGQRGAGFHHRMPTIWLATATTASTMNVASASGPRRPSACRAIHAAPAAATIVAPRVLAGRRRSAAGPASRSSGAWRVGEAGEATMG
jgi:hypothetical protein